MTDALIERRTFGPADGVPEPVAPYAHAVRAGPLLFLTGQLPLDPESGDLIGHGVAAQTDAVITNLVHVLECCGASLADVVQTRAYLTSMDLYEEFNTTYARHFTAGLPARTCTGVTGLARGALVEIDAVAYLLSGP